MPMEGMEGIQSGDKSPHSKESYGSLQRSLGWAPDRRPLENDIGFFRNLVGMCVGLAAFLAG